MTKINQTTPPEIKEPTPTEKTTQPKPPKVRKPQSNLFRILGFWSEFKWRILAVILVGSISIIMYAFMPQVLGNTFDVIKKELLMGIPESMHHIIFYLIMFGVLAVFNALFDIFCIFTILKYEYKIMHKKIVEIKRKLDVVPSSFLEKYSVGELTRRTASLSSEIIKTVLTTTYTIARVTVFFLTTAIMMFTINWLLGIVVTLSVPLCVITARFVSKRTQKFFNNYAKASSDAYAYVDQSFTLHEFYNLHGLEGGTEYPEINAKVARTMIGENTSLAFNTIYITFIQNFMYLLVTVLFGVLFITQVIPTEFGVLPAFLMYSNRFLANAVVVTTATNLLQGISAKASRVLEILDYPEDVTDKEHIDIKHIVHEIEFKKVSLTDGTEKLLDNVSFTIPQGANVAIVGPTGCGKSRIVELLAKLAIPAGGQIKIDGVNLDEINSRSYYKCMGLALERPFIFRGTVAENLLYGIRRELPENVMDVTERLGSHQFIAALDDGYETMLSENSSLLSDSQKQLINAARLVLLSPDLAIFNETLSNSDTVTEKSIFEEIMRAEKNLTTIFITHRLASIEKCDIIFYMEKGRIVEKGTHAQLLAKKGRYYKAFIGE